MMLTESLEKRPVVDASLASRRPNMIAAETGEEAVILDVDSGYFFQLNRSATRIWTLLETPTTVADLCARMGTMFAVEAETCRADVIEFVTDLRDRGLIELG